MVHTTCLIKIIQQSLTRKYKDQTKVASLTDVATPTTLMKGVVMSGPMPEPHTYAHHQMTGGLTKIPNSKFGAQTDPANPEPVSLHTLKKSPPPSSSGPS
jgi:hypothetical protein